MELLASLGGRISWIQFNWGMSFFKQVLELSVQINIHHCSAQLTFNFAKRGMELSLILKSLNLIGLSASPFHLKGVAQLIHILFVLLPEIVADK